VTNLEALLVTATTLEQIEVGLTASCERDIKAAVHLALGEVKRLIEEEIAVPGPPEDLGDGSGRSI